MTKALGDKKSVLVIIRWPVGGIRTFSRYVYRNFEPERWRFTIIAPELEEMRVLMSDLAGLEVSYLPVHRMPVDGSSGFWKMTRSVARQLANSRYDLVHSQGFTSGMCAAIPAFLSRTPHLMTSHDIINEKQFAGGKGILKRKIMGFLFRLIDTVQSVSYDAHENLIANFPSLGCRRDKCVVIVNGIEVERFENASPRDFRGELKVRENVFLIGFLGRFMNQKGFRYLVDAIEILRQDSSLPKQPLVLTFGDGGFIQEEQQAINERGIDKYFRFMPFASNVAATIKGLDVVAMPSLWEACPLQPMEALVCGTPFIGSNCIGLREVLRSTPARVCPAGDSEALARAIMQEMLDRSKKKALAFMSEAAARFDVKQRASEIEELMQECLERRRRRNKRG